MTPEEFDFIRAAIKSAYPSFNIMPDKYSIKVWYRMLGDLDFKLCETALLELIATHTYPPQIAEIRAKCAEYNSPQLKDAGEAWGEIQMAIRKYGYYRADEALESLSAPVRTAAERIGFRELCTSENPEANRAHFFKIYNAIAERESQNAMIPVQILEQKEAYQNKISMQDAVKIEDKRERSSEIENCGMKSSSQEYIDNLLRKHGFR